jgi:epoxide hydrolase-like predicted phosphatase
VPIKAIAFDLGGVIFPWPAPEYFARWEQRLSASRGSFDALVWNGPDIEAANIGALTAEEYIVRCARRLDAEEDLVREMIEHAFATERIDQALVDYVRSLQGRVRIAALTNTWSFGRRLAQERGVADLFELFVSSAEEGVRKPDRRIFEVLLTGLGLEPSDVAFVDDTEENIVAARALGIHAVRHLSADATIRTLERLIRRGSATV